MMRAMGDSSHLLPTSCRLCPRACGANRRAGERGICGADDSLLVARAALHHWEEPPISGTGGSGTVFFSNCPLHCVYCQNEPLSSGRAGKTVSVQRLAEMFCELEGQGAHNINLVTPTQYVPQIISAVGMARDTGMGLPIVYNTSGYESTETIKLLAGTVGIYLTDFKYASGELAARYSNVSEKPRARFADITGELTTRNFDVSDYPEVALEALKEMVEQAGEYRIDDDGIMQGGVILRHLMLPGQVNDSKEVVRRVFDAVGNRVCYSLMNQYTPMPNCAAYPELARTVTEGEYGELIDFALDLGIIHSFMQEGGTATESFIPPFDLTGV